ncbi:hypothetical protein [Actinomadura chibensis]|uniref:Uncharacterized protein n=1 Tax=Actinomadura chibensis TaxID=392828 RepID=A0A5D0NY49_9ACTN|nr:hypothetical protein [Actinomadura chibensis]TYB49520.1 hypothetical protein FXF69_10720 [Actinomadura chibensis]
MLVPPAAPAALPRPLTARRRLNRLGRALRRQGWIAERRYADAVPLLRVHSPDMPFVGESVCVVGGDGGWWFRFSTGTLLAPCARMDLAVWQVTALLTAAGLGAGAVPLDE